ncbi:MAG: MCE family protein [Lewinellaceae bacterium]|nr:MCE family protein [Lewinellaceae bacterium]
MSKEVKVGILAVVAIAFSFWGFQFIRGKNALTRSNVFYVEYDNVNRIQISTPVKYLGFQVGFVSEITPQLDKKNIRLTLDLDKTMRIPKNTQANILTETFMGSASIILDIQGDCQGPDCLTSGSTLQGRNLGILGSMVDKDDLKDYVKIVQEGLQVLMDSLSKQMNDPNAKGPLAESMRDLRGTLHNLNSTTGQLDRLLAGSAGDIKGTMANLNSISRNFKANNAQISSILASADTFSTRLSAMDLSATMQKVDASLDNLQSTLSSANTAFSGINTLMGSIEKGEGSLGKLMQDEKLYNNLSSISVKADSLVQDLQERPYRYIPFKNRKKVKRYDRLDTPATKINE